MTYVRSFVCFPFPFESHFMRIFTRTNKLVTEIFLVWKSYQQRFRCGTYIWLTWMSNSSCHSKGRSFASIRSKLLAVGYLHGGYWPDFGSQRIDINGYKRWILSQFAPRAGWPLKKHLSGNSQTLRRVRKINAKLTQSTLIYVTKFCVRIQILGGQPLEHFLITNLENRFWN